MFKKLFSGVQNKYKQIQEESTLYLKLLNTTNTIAGLTSLPTISKNDMTVSYKHILDICPDLNDNKALLIRSLLPINEVYLTVMYSKECKTSLEYFLVPTTKYFWIISVNGYIRFKYDGLHGVIIKNNLMSKVLNIGNILFEVNGNNDSISNFLNIINDSFFRNNLIKEKLSIFCGIIPIKSFINEIGTGISIDSNSNVVFHGKDFNYLYNIIDIKNYELLLDDNVVVEKKSNRRVRLTANKNSCYEMNIRITTTDKSFTIPIIEKTTFTELYQATNSKYIEGKNFAVKIIEVLDDLDEKKLNGEYKNNTYY